MKILSSIMILQGLLSGMQAYNNFFHGNTFRYGTKHLNSNFHVIGAIVGVLIIFTGVGIWFEKKSAYYSTIILYSLLITYGLFSIVYLSVTEGFNLTSTILVIIVMSVFFFIIRYTQKHKFLFDKNNI